MRASLLLTGVIARSEATKQSRIARRSLDCFASLAMTEERHGSHHFRERSGAA